MLIGAMADTHDRLDAVDKAINYFNSQEITDVLHAGDLVSPFVVPLFSKLKAKLHFVWGNNEGDRDFTKIKFAEIGIAPLGDFVELKLCEKRIALIHGTEQRIVDSLVTCGSYDLVVRGHNHKAGIITGRTLVVNPGEVCGYLTNRQTVAVIDLQRMQGQIVEL